MSQFLALFRDRLLAGTFGVDVSLDVYYAAFRIPDLLFFSVASLFSSAVVIPFFIQKLEKSEESASVLLASLVRVFGIIMVPILVCAWIAMPVLAPLAAPGFGTAEQELLVSLSRVLLLSPMLLGLSGIISGAVQAMRYFLLYSLAPILYNIGIIVGIFFLVPKFGVVGVAWGVALGALLHLLIQIPALSQRGLRMVGGAVTRDVDRVIMTSLPRTLALSLTQLQMIILTAIASLFAAGSIAAFQFAFNLQSIPLSLVGVSYSIAAFPALASFWAKKQNVQFADAVIRARGHILVWSVLLSVVFVLLREPIVSVVLGVQGVSPEEISLIANTMALFAFSLAPQGIVLLYTRVFYAAGKTAIPLVINIISVSSALLLSFVLLKSSTDLYILPISFSAGMFLNAVLLVLFARIKLEVVAVKKIAVHLGISVVFATAIVMLVHPIFLGFIGKEALVQEFFSAFVAGMSALASAILYLYMAGVNPAVELVHLIKQKMTPRK
ncbi:MAG: lipid II flippase MurJ [bacterium]|nr:lipid II flippase MurJ [bacterium]